MAWQYALLRLVQNPLNSEEIQENLEWGVVLRDRYPKSHRHILILPKKVIHNPMALRSEDLPLIRQMWEYALSIQEREGPKLIGFHAIPSMFQLHLHVLDHDLQNINRRETWNSYTTPFLLSPSWVIHELETHGKLCLPEQIYSDYLKGPMYCHLCQQTFSTIPEAKRHMLCTHASALCESQFRI